MTGQGFPPPSGSGPGQGEGWQGPDAAGGEVRNPTPGWRPPTGGDGPPGWLPPTPGQPSAPSGQPPPGAVPRCYRHTDRETYVSCQRCGRSICPDCMRPAAVGFHCPEEHDGGRGGQAQRRPRNVLGGRAGRPVIVTQVLIGLCVAAYMLQGFPLFDGRLNDFTLNFALNDAAVAVDDQYYRLISAAFLHGHILHIMFNMMALYILGTQLEATVGRARYITLFFVCAFGGNALSYIVGEIPVQRYLCQERLLCEGVSFPFQPVPISLGASTAVFGFFAAYYLVARRLRADTSGILVVIGINLVLTFTLSNIIDIWGHIGGLATGLIVGLVFAYVPPRKAVLQAAAVAGVAALLVAAVLVKSASVTVPAAAGLVG